MPGLIKYEVSQGSIISPYDNSDIYFIATLYFDSLDAIKKAFASQEGQACAADRKILIPNEENVQITCSIQMKFNRLILVKQWR